MSDNKDRLHSIIAVEKDVKAKNQSVFQETLKIFNRPESFEGFTKVYTPKEEDGTEFPTERKELVTTVHERLNYTFKNFANLLDLLGKKESSNTMAKADLIVDGETLAKDVPATLLLDLEKHFKEVLNILQRIPTLPSDVAWEVDPNAEKKGVVRTKYPVETLRNVKIRDFRTVAEATKEHKAQIAEVEKTVVEGTWKHTHWSGMISSAEKSRYINNVELLIRGAKKARMRANNQEVSASRLGKQVHDFMMNHESVEE